MSRALNGANDPMDDMTATRLCAEAMGIEHRVVDNYYVEYRPHDADPRWWKHYDPLHDDAQAMALVKRFGLLIEGDGINPTQHWNVQAWHTHAIQWRGVEDEDLNRAIVYCVAKMQEAMRPLRDRSNENS